MQKRLNRLPLVILAIVLAAAVSVPVAAHHGWGGNSEQESELTGTVEVPVSLAGPHATMKVRANGQVWDITLAPSNRTAENSSAAPTPSPRPSATERARPRGT